jgi:hypothetical protein
MMKVRKSIVRGGGGPVTEAVGSNVSARQLGSNGPVANAIRRTGLNVWKFGVWQNWVGFLSEVG